MSVHLQREIHKLKQDVLAVCALVEHQVEASMRALIERDGDLAKEVECRDLEIDDREVEVEEECLKVLALYQPVAVDLRLIVSALKINNDLERIGDLAVNIARKASTLSSLPAEPVPPALQGMAEKTQSMLRDSIDAMVNTDSALARDVCLRDDEVDQLKRVVRDRALAMLQENAARIDYYFCVTGAARNLERIADLATNIAEDVIYLVEGEITRHKAARNESESGLA